MTDGTTHSDLVEPSVLDAPGLVIDLRGPGVPVTAHGRQWRVAPGTSLTMGRAPQCDIVFADQSVSRLHARLTVDSQGAASIVDLDSTNGTYRESVRLPASVHVALESGTALTLGLSDDVVMIGEPAAVLDVDEACLTATRARELLIGRAADNDVQLHDPEVSRRHARARACESGFEVTDLGSSNGTYINGQPIQHAFLGPRDTLSIGRSTFRVISGHLVHSASAGIHVRAVHLGVQLRGGQQLLHDVSFEVPAGHLMAVVGPSGAGKTTLLRALTGSRRGTTGTVRLDGRDLYDEYPALRNRIGVVPQDDIVHHELSVNQALRYAAEIRLASDLDANARRKRVQTVLAQLKLSEHQHTSVSKLSGGQRKRVSVAMELLTEPGLLILDEPTSGLDPGLDRSVMELLRSLADAGRTVIVITHNLANLHLCDEALLLAPGGTVAYAGRPEGMLPFFDVPDYADAFNAVAADPAGATERFTRARPDVVEAADPPGYEQLRPARRRGRRRDARQLVTLLRRQVRVVTADASYALATVALPAVLALLALAIPGEDGLAGASDASDGEASQLLAIVMVGAAFMGAAASMRELVRERAIFLRERAAGLSAGAYLVSKVIFVFVLAAIQAAVLVALVSAFKPRPDDPVLIRFGAAAGHWGAGVELYAATAATAFASAVAGLLISSLVRTSEQVMPALVVLVMSQLVFCGGLITITDRVPLEQLSWLTPSRWGFAAAAASVDLRSLQITAPADDLWSPTASAWMVAMGALGAIAVVCAVATWLRLRRVASV